MFYKNSALPNIVFAMNNNLTKSDLEAFEKSLILKY